ncbi:fimbrial protein [Serratia fonticola]|uniref:fimbrial protein n=1 Tax=Serratia fonticola TaxID=47917 RepID=UPI0013778994|nr:fimbrial protein [Serratia fonticola]NCG54502.1 fimbrial protein [Serratia fonticola]
MPLLTRCLKYSSTSLLLLLLLLVCSLPPLPASAVTLNFSATITPPTCDVSLSRDTLPLGAVPLSSLRAGGRFAEQRTRVNISNCEGGPLASGRRVAVKVSGESIKLANGRWVFRSNESVATGVGALIEEVRTAGTSNLAVEPGRFLFDTATLPSPGSSYMADLSVALTCGDTAAQCQSVTAGRFIARIQFDFVYR